MKIIYCGDVVGRSGREAVLSHIKDLREDYKADFVIVNAPTNLLNRLTYVSSVIVTIFKTINNAINVLQRKSRKVMNFHIPAPFIDNKAQVI